VGFGCSGLIYGGCGGGGWEGFGYGRWLFWLIVGWEIIIKKNKKYNI
jgi:hypothetical protein